MISKKRDDSFDVIPLFYNLRALPIDNLFGFDWAETDRKR